MDNVSLISIIVFAVVVIVFLRILMQSVFRLWLRALLCRGRVPLMSIIGMRLRGSPAELLVDTYIMMLRKGEYTTIEEVESVYLENKYQVTDAESLIELVRDKTGKKEFNAL